MNTTRRAASAAILAVSVTFGACDRRSDDREGARPAAARIDPAERDLAERNERLAAQQRREQPPTGDAAVSMVSGRIVELGEKELVLKRDDGEEPNVILVLAPEAAVTVAGKQARPSDLKEGMHVRAAFESVNDKEIAVRVDARP